MITDLQKLPYRTQCLLVGLVDLADRRLSLEPQAPEPFFMIMPEKQTVPIRIREVASRTPQKAGRQNIRI